ncbi:MAG: endonuclease domain-containing protein [Sideroxydans sp.]|nr:endonuclease domain-containing protein [Sideroxydans sp.]
MSSSTTPPLRGTPPEDGNKSSRASNSPPLEGWQAQPDGVVKSRYTKNYQSLPYNPQLKERAKALRRAGNLSEVLLWNQLKRGQLKGLDFDRQKIIGNYIVDFYCAEKQAVLEVDGSSHDDKAEYDAQRDAFLRGLGLCVIHILDVDVKQNLAGVMDFLTQQLFPSGGGVDSEAGRAG